MGNPKRISKAKVFAGDAVWSIMALGLINVLTQFVMYPILRNTLGSEQYGNVLYLISTVNILATAGGTSANLARLVASVKGKTSNLDNAIWLLCVQIVAFPVCCIVMYFSGMTFSVWDIVLLWILASATIWRNYADVEYRLSTNYKGYFLYYFTICIGYLLGILLYWQTKCWQLILLPGELAGLLLVKVRGSIFKMDGPLNFCEFRSYFSSVFSLMVAQLLVNVVLNSDRLVLNTVIGGTAVTVFYVASLLGKTMALISAPLNSVIIGHLAKSDKRMTPAEFLKLSGLGLFLSGVALLICVGGSYIFTKVFYPAEYVAAKQLFWIANLSQVFYFATGVLTTVLLRYIREKFQVIINVAYVLIFALVAIPSAKIHGLQGFALGILFVNGFRYVFATILGTIELWKNESDPQKERVN